MRKTLLLAAALVASAALWRTARPALADDAPLDAAEALPGIETAQLTPAQREAAVRVAREQFCHCGCPHTLTQCLRTHKECRHAPRMARLAVRLAEGSKPAAEIKKMLDEYYGSFEKPRRARLTLDGFGPPQGDEKAPVTLVEFSDFGCPFCQVVKPLIDDFLKANAGRVRFFYKPFPLPQHPRALEAAVAAEWAREQGRFWPMYDGLFGNPNEFSDEDLAERAREIGADPTALKAALSSTALRAKISASQLEGRTAGLRGTPTLYWNGRRMVLPDFSPVGLQHNLEDEEEWTRHGGWARD